MKRKLFIPLFVLILVLSGCKDKQEPRDTEELDTCITQIIESDNIDGCTNPRGKFSDYIEQYFVRFEEEITIDNTTATYDSASDLLYFYVIINAPDTTFSTQYDALETMYKNVLEDLANSTDVQVWFGLQFNHGSATHKITFNHQDLNLSTDTLIVSISTMSEIDDIYTPYLEWLEEISTTKTFQKVEFKVSGFDHSFDLSIYPDEEVYNLVNTQLQASVRLTETALVDSLMNALPNSYTEVQ
jgi:hypothetical protein